LKKYRKITFIVAAATLLAAGYFLTPPSFPARSHSTTIESAEGILLGARIASDGQWRFPATGPLPEKYKHCLVAFEDRRFYSHPGIDPLAIARALRTNIKHGKVLEGGSTLSMQTVRLMRQGRLRTIREKLIETILAIRLEIHYSKEEILHLYAHNAPFGGNVVGLRAAAWRYFGHASDELSWAEAATLAVLPNAPALIHPGRNREHLLRKRNRLLAQLSRQGLLSPEDLLLAQAEPLPDKPLPLPADAPHLLERLAATGAGQNYRTSLPYTLQQRAMSIVNRHARRLQGNKVHNLAAIILENKTGRVLAYVGNASPISPSSHAGHQVDIITAPRSTGSILKPFLFAAGLDDGIILPKMLLSDIPTYINGFVPQNYDKAFAGAVPANMALARSLNIPSVLLLQDYGVERFHALLHKMGITTITQPPAHYGLSLILGGAEVTLWDVTNAYASMARTLNGFDHRSGQYAHSDWQPPGLLLQSPAKDTESLHNQPIISAAACWQIVEALSETNRPEGEEEWQKFPSSRKIAWKTGTSFGNRDAWAVGLTPEYTIGVWAGNASGEGRPLLTGVTAAAPVLFDLFHTLPNTSWFSPPYDEMTYVALCRQSGHRATELCTAVDSAWVHNRGLDSPPCPYHQLVHLDREARYRVSADCEQPAHILSTSWFVLPPAQEHYYKMRHHSYKQLPPWHPGCLAATTESPIGLIYPQRGFRIVLTRQMDGTRGQLVMQATHRRAEAAIHWHLDDQYLGTTQSPHRMAALPDTGRHVITLVDDQGATLSTPFQVRGTNN
jgi:penicillin-binding protein 1C